MESVSSHPQELKISIPAFVAKKSKPQYRFLLWNLILLPFICLAIGPMFLGADENSLFYIILTLLGIEAFIFICLFAAKHSTSSSRVNSRPWEITLNPYQINFANGSLPLYLLESVEYLPKSFLAMNAGLQLQWKENQFLVSGLIPCELSEEKAQEVVSQINEYLEKYRDEINDTAQTPFHQAMPYLALPQSCRMKLIPSNENPTVIIQSLKDLYLIDQTFLFNSAQSYSLHHDRLELSPEALIYKSKAESVQIPWTQIREISIRNVRKRQPSPLSDSDDYAHFDELYVAWDQYELVVASVWNALCMRHQLLWLQDLIQRYQANPLNLK